MAVSRKWFLGVALLSVATACFAQGTSEPAPGPPHLTAPASNPELIRLVEAKRWKDVVALTTQELHNQPDDPMLLYWQGLGYLQQRDSVHAVQSLRGAEKLGLGTVQLHEDLGLAYYNLNQFNLFEEQMRKAAALDPRDASPNYYVGLYRLNVRSDFGGALELFEKSIQLNAGDWKSLYQSGYCLEQMGKIEEAKTRYTKSIAILDGSQDPFGWPYRGMARILLDSDPAAALTFAKKAVEREPGEPSNHLVLAQAYEQVGDLARGTREAQIAAELNPNDSKTLYILYKFYRKASDPRAADELKAFEQARDLYDAN